MPARCLDSENMSQAAMNRAAMTGPMTKPFIPNVAIPPSVEISTTDLALILGGVALNAKRRMRYTRAAATSSAN